MIKKILTSRLDSDQIKSHEALDSLIRVVRKLPPRPENTPPYEGIFGKGKTLFEYLEKAKNLINVDSSFNEVYDSREAHNYFRKIIGQPECPKERDLAECWKALGINKPTYLYKPSQYEEFFGRQLSPKEYADLESVLLKMRSGTERQLFLAQVHHETAGLRWLLELASRRDYEGRQDLGNINPGDGVRYKGAGALQLTGRFNYEKLAKATNDNKVMTLGAAYVAENYPFTSALVWWEANNMSERISHGLDIVGVSKAVNGGTNGLQDRINQYNRAKKIF